MNAELKKHSDSRLAGMFKRLKAKTNTFVKSIQAAEQIIEQASLRR